jgi:uncharacterized protein with HEPN domain
MRDERQYLFDIVEASEFIAEQVIGITFEAFTRDQPLQHSILFSFAIIGEAASKISAKTKAEYPDIDWKSIVGFRNIIVHAYFSLNLMTVWKAATERVIPLADHVNTIIKVEFKTNKDE